MTARPWAASAYSGSNQRVGSPASSAAADSRFASASRSFTGPSWLAELGEGQLQLIQTMVELGLGDHDRGGQPDGRAVGVLGQHTAAGQRLTQVAAAGQGGIEIHPGPQAARAYADHAAPEQRVQALPHPQPQ